MTMAALQEQSTKSITASVPAPRPTSHDREWSIAALRIGAAGAIVLAALTFTSARADAASILDSIAGTWTGRGTVTFEGGNSESLSCRAYYATGGSALSLAIRCASPSYKTELRSKLHLANGSLAGEWEERNFNAVGSASGVLAGNTIALRISGAINGRLTIDQTGPRQAVTISTSGSGLASVKIGFTRS
jgi:hypothetical protein